MKESKYTVALLKMDLDFSTMFGTCKASSGALCTVLGPALQEMMWTDCRALWRVTK